MKTIRVLIIERDQTILNKILKTLRNTHFVEIIGLVRSIEEGITYLNSRHVDVTIVNYLILENVCLEQSIDCVKKNIRIKKIVISTVDKNDLYYNVFKIGTTDVIPQDNINLISEIIDHVNTDNYYNHIVLEVVRKEFIRLQKLEQQLEIERAKSILTLRELEILRLIDQGLTQTEITKELHISIRTVKNHVTNILSKMNEKNSKEAAKRAKEIGVI